MLFVLVLIPAAAPVPPPRDPLPPAVRKAVEEVKKHMAAPTIRDAEVRVWREAGGKFDKALDRLATAVEEARFKQPAAGEGGNLDARLLAIAADRRRRPEVYRAMAKYYVRDPSPNTVGWVPAPSPRPADLRKDCRLVWEYLLLYPSGKSETDDYAERAMNALPVIGGDESLPALVARFRLLCRKHDKEDTIDADQRRRNQVWHTLEKFRTAAGVRAMLECAAWARKQWAGLPYADFRPDYARWLRYQLTGFNKGSWAAAVKALPRDRLPADQRKLLAEALKED